MTTVFVGAVHWQQRPHGHAHDTGKRAPCCSIRRDCGINAKQICHSVALGGPRQRRLDIRIDRPVVQTREAYTTDAPASGAFAKPTTPTAACRCKAVKGPRLPMPHHLCLPGCPCSGLQASVTWLGEEWSEARVLMLALRTTTELVLICDFFL